MPPSKEPKLSQDGYQEWLDRVVLQAEDSRSRVLRAVTHASQEAYATSTQDRLLVASDIASEVGLRLSTTRDILRGLEAEGLVCRVVDRNNIRWAATKIGVEVVAAHIIRAATGPKRKSGKAETDGQEVRPDKSA